MSTKNLARTALEGGRWRAGRRLRRKQNVKLRVAERAALGRIARDSEREDLILPGRPKIAREFGPDKLSAPLRWLGRQVGRPWNLVQGELFARFDTRTTPGRHIVFDHMLSWVDDGRTGWGWFRFVVDRNGLLRRAPERSRSRLRSIDIPRPRPDLEAWLAGRRVGARGDVLFWFTPTPAGAYRQHHPLAEEDAARWRALPSWFRDRNDPAAAFTSAAWTASPRRRR